MLDCMRVGKETKKPSATEFLSRNLRHGACMLLREVLAVLPGLAALLAVL